MSIGEKEERNMAMWRCNVCGQTFEAENPTECPICGAGEDALEKVEE